MWKYSLLKTLQRASKQGLRSHFQVVQNFELKRIGGAPKDHQITPLNKTGIYEQPLLRSLNFEVQVTVHG